MAQGLAEAAGPNGRAPLDKILLPHARNRWALPRAAGMTPDAIGDIMAEALTSTSPRREQELYDVMFETWPRLVKNTTDLADAAIGLDWSVMEPEEIDPIPGAAELARKARLGMRPDPLADGQGWEGTSRGLLQGFFRGIAVHEIDWEYRAGGLMPRQTRAVPTWHYGWRRGGPGSSIAAQSSVPPQPEDGRLVLYRDAWSRQGTEFPPDKFLVAVRKVCAGHPSGGALLRSLAWWWAAQSFSAGWLLSFAQIFGQPFRWATYKLGQPNIKEQLAALLEAMGAAGFGVFPEGTTLEFREAAKSGQDNPQKAVIDAGDRVCDLLLLGQTLTSDVGDSGSLALGQEHSRVRGDRVDSAAAWLAAIYNEQLVPSLAALNIPGGPHDFARLPYFEPSRKEVRDAKAMIERDVAFLGAAPVKKDWLYERHDIPAPEPGDEVIGPIAAPPPAPSPLALLQATSASAPPNSRDGLLWRAITRMPAETRAYILEQVRRLGE
ncbi:MAG: DUF935 family protein [Verrucomicrobiae bacterium]|nr:DUF935 family protein [Verrucomicrobiae bacterium]